MKTLLISFKSIIVIIGILFLQISCAINPRINYNVDQKTETFMTGLDVLAENDFLQLKGKKVGLKFNLKQGPDFGPGPYSPWATNW